MKSFDFVFKLKNRSGKMSEHDDCASAETVARACLDV